MEKKTKVRKTLVPVGEISKAREQGRKDAERELTRQVLGNVLFALVHELVNCPGTSGKRCKKFRGHDGECG